MLISNSWVQITTVVGRGAQIQKFGLVPLQVVYSGVSPTTEDVYVISDNLKKSFEDTQPFDYIWVRSLVRDVEISIIEIDLSRIPTLYTINNSDVQFIPEHDGTIATEVVVNYGSYTGTRISVVDGVVDLHREVLNGINASIEFHLSREGSAGDVSLRYWNEISLDRGVSWTIIPLTTREEIITRNGAGDRFSDISTAAYFPQDALIRTLATKIGGGGTLSFAAPAPLITSNGTTSGYAKKATFILDT